MRPSAFQILALILASAIAFPPSVFCETKPTLIVPPLVGAGNDKARTALITSLRATGRVSVVAGDAVDNYLRDRAGSGAAPKARRGDSEAASALKRGIDAFRALKIEESLDQLARAKRMFRDNLSDEGAFEGLRAAQFFLARSYLAKRESGRAKTELTQAVILDPERSTRTLSPKLYPPELRKLFDEARKEIAKKPHGDLDITSDPPGAVVYVDGKAAGSAPIRVEALPVGEHFIRAEADGRESYFSSHTVVAGENRTSLELKAVKRIDPEKYFSPVAQASDIEHSRAAFLDEMGVALGGDIFLLLAPESGAVRAQLYDQRSQEVSPMERGTSPDDLANRLVRYIDAGGYVAVPQKDTTPEPRAAIPARELPENLRPAPETRLSEQSEQALPTQSLPSKRGVWYENTWLWVAVAGGLLIAGGSVFLFTDIGKKSASNSTLTFTVPGK